MAFFNFRLFKILVNKKEHSRHFAYSKIHTYIFLFPILGPKLSVFLVTGYRTQSSLPINYTRDSCPYFLCYLSDRNNYRTRAIISRGLYIFYPIFKEVFSENFVLMYGLYSRAASNQERLMMARVR